MRGNIYEWLRCTKMRLTWNTSGTTKRSRSENLERFSTASWMGHWIECDALSQATWVQFPYPYEHFDFHFDIWHTNQIFKYQKKKNLQKFSPQKALCLVGSLLIGGMEQGGPYKMYQFSMDPPCRSKHPHQTQCFLRAKFLLNFFFGIWKFALVPNVEMQIKMFLWIWDSNPGYPT